jgi:hypothetical protein
MAVAYRFGRYSVTFWGPVLLQVHAYEQGRHRKYQRSPDRLGTSRRRTSRSAHFGHRRISMGTTLARHNRSRLLWWSLVLRVTANQERQGSLPDGRDLGVFRFGQANAVTIARMLASAGGEPQAQTLRSSHDIFVTAKRRTAFHARRSSRNIIGGSPSSVVSDRHAPSL